MVDTRKITNSNQALAFIKANKLDNMPLSSNNIEKFGLFFWTKNSRQRVKLIKRDFIGENILKAEIHGEGPTTRYVILGKHITRFIKKYGDTLAFLETPRKEKNAWNKKWEGSQK